MKIPTIDKLYFSPVKSLSFANSENLIVRKNTGIKDDRIFAFTRLIEKNESTNYEKFPDKRNLNFFLTLKNSPFLNKYNFHFKQNELSLLLNNRLIKKISLNDKGSFEVISKELMKRERLITKIPYFIYNSEFPFFDTMPNNSVSLININSIKDFEKKINRRIEHERFRGNIYIKNVDPWIEYTWINKEILIDACLFKVTGKIPRCSATNLIPDSDASNINIPKKLKDIYGNSHMGLYLVPLNDGTIEIDNTIKILR